MTAMRRWLIVAAVVTALIGLTVAARARPVPDPAGSPSELVERIRAAADQPFQGYLETRGSLQLPVASRFTDVGELFGERSRMRVWWRAADDWRVDKLSTAGETDLIHDGPRTVEWNYERAQATVYLDPAIRLPRTSDLLPPTLATRALTGARSGDVSALDARRVAGRTAAGVRFRPSSPITSIDHVDIWADAASGIPLRVEVYDAPSAAPVFRSEFREFSTDPPPVGRTSFVAPAGADVRFDDALDIADAANQFVDAVPPAELVGLPLAPAAAGAVGVYGSGLTQLLVVPLWDRAATPLREQLQTAVASRVVDGDTVLTVGPLGVLLTRERGGAGWLVTGTVTEDTLVRAAAEITAHANGLVR